MLIGSDEDMTGREAEIVLRAYRGHTDTSAGKSIELTLRAIVQMNAETVAETKGQLPMWGGVLMDREMRDGVSAKLPVSFTAVMGDHDAGTMSVSTAAALMAAAGVAGAVIETASSTPTSPRWRAIAPTSGPLPMEQFPEQMSKLNTALEGSLASESWTAKQGYYYGHIKGSRVPDGKIVSGACIDQLKIHGTSCLFPPASRSKDSESGFRALASEFDLFDESTGGEVPWSERPSQERIFKEAIATGANIHSAVLVATMWVATGKVDQFGGENLLELLRLTAEVKRGHARAAQVDYEWAQALRGANILVKRAEEEKAESADSTPSVAYLNELLNRPPRTLEEMRTVPENDYFIDGLVITSLAGTLIAKGGEGKTTLFIQMACAAATGRDFIGFDIKMGSTVLLSIDDVQRDLDAALAIHINGTGYSDEEVQLIAKRVRLISLKGAPFATSFAMMEHGGSVVRSQMSEWLFKSLSGVEGLVCVIFDTMRQFAGGSPNDDQVVTVLTQEVSALAEKLGVATMVAHHMTKEGSRSGQSDQFSGTGSGAIADNLRFVLTLNKVTREDAEKAVRLGEGETLPPEDEINQFLRLDDTRGSITRKSLGSIYMVRRDGCFRQLGSGSKTQNERLHGSYLTIMRMVSRGEGSVPKLRQALGVKIDKVGPLVQSLITKGLLSRGAENKPPHLTPQGMEWLRMEETGTDF